MEQPDKEALDKWHRWFAVECNNRAWELAAVPGRTPEEDREMLSAAYAAAFHWSKVGKPVNTMRADLLLAHVHALLGHGREALAYAASCLRFCETNEHEAWDVAFAHLEMALAAATSGDAEQHARHYAIACGMGERLEDEEDRQCFAEELDRIPVPSGAS